MQGFIAATNIKFAGYWIVPETREITTLLSSNGWRSTSSTSLGNSVNSSKNNIHLCAKLISPGVRRDHPPVMEILEAV